VSLYQRLTELLIQQQVLELTHPLKNKGVMTRKMTGTISEKEMCT